MPRRRQNRAARTLAGRARVEQLRKLRVRAQQELRSTFAGEISKATEDTLQRGRTALAAVVQQRHSQDEIAVDTGVVRQAVEKIVTAGNHLELVSLVQHPLSFDCSEHPYAFDKIESATFTIDRAPKTSVTTWLNTKLSPCRANIHYTAAARG
ncbi:hypothetical protein CF319_g9033 [Tilletia indica]|uniref:Uncharacterized protein n=1 Tax=Tilletia indica TaxID=43049 RepID=A0A8T8SCX6_9BASI|nr:hypothetical protein CF319_g9033 [Tilletia indica]KAE8237300.1 hypothetical protein A4X13_0g8839 [Tilletia indica]